jgi:hypothetical protein
MLMPSRDFRKFEAEQLDLFRPRTARPNWHSMPSEAKHRATNLLAQLIADYVSNQTAASDQKELTDE